MTVDPIPEPLPAVLWASLPRKRVGAGLLVTGGDGRVLLVEPTYKPGWEVPGGLVEAGESPRSAARREAREELGVDVEVGRLLVVDWVPTGRRPDDGLMLIYACGPLDPERIVLPADELRSWRWCDEADVEARTTSFMARRLRAALLAQAAGVTVELENGLPPGASS